jgi:PAS domain S-box-containing protein
VRYDPAIKQNLNIEFPAQIRRIASIPSDSTIFRGNGPAISPSLELPYNENSIRFEYSVPFFKEISETKFQYFLDGYDIDWSNLTQEIKKDYTNLADGEYSFKVRAKNIFNRISPVADYTFRIKAPWYWSWWAYAGYIILFAIGLFVIARGMRSHLIKREQKRAELREAEIISKKNRELQQKNEQLEDILSKLQMAQNSLIESESRFRSVAESANDALITADKTGNITFWNKSAETIFGYTQEEVMGKPLTILMPERYRNAHLKGLERFYTTGQEKIMGDVVELEAVKKDGKEFPIELTLANWETHEETFVTGIVRDMTIRKQKEEALRDTQNQLFQSEKLSTLGKLSAGIAHELNNPAGSALRSSSHLHKTFVKLQRGIMEIGRLNLSAKQMASLSDLDQMAKNYAENPIRIDAPLRSDKEHELENWLDSKEIPDAWEIAPALVSLEYNQDKLNSLSLDFPLPAFTTIITWLCASFTIYSLLMEISIGTDRIAEIVKAFKSYTYMDQAPRKKVNIQKDLENALVLFQSRLKSGITILRNYDENLPLIEAYGGQLNQVWTNLIDNAIDAMGKVGELILKTYRDNAYLIVEITDNGRGIPKQFHSKIFDPFFTTKKVGAGAGLGLNLSHNIIVQNHHGEISFTSKPGKTTFVVRLPLKISNSTKA